MEGEKRCSKCGDPKPLGDFHKHPLGAQGRQSRCKSCARDVKVEKYRNDPDYRTQRAAENRAYLATEHGGLVYRLSYARCRLKTARRPETQARLREKIATLEAELLELRGGKRHVA